MLEKVDLTLALTKKEYRARRQPLQRRLFELQRACRDADVGVVVVLEGWSTAGKGSLIKRLTERLEPRAFEIHPLFAPRTHELPLPWLYRFWVRLPRYGRVAVFDHAWHQVIAEGLVKGSLSQATAARQVEDVNSFERALSDDRYVVAKFFLHISQATQSRRLEELAADPRTMWRIDASDRQQQHDYAAYSDAFEEVLAATETARAPWTILEAEDERWARVRFFETLIERLEAELDERRDGGAAASRQGGS